MNTLRVILMGWMVAIMLLFCACASTMETFEYVSDKEIKPGPGLFTGENGTLTIYSQPVPVKPEENAASEEDQTQPARQE